MDISDKPFICDEVADLSLRFLGEERSTRHKAKLDTQLGRPKLNPSISAILYEAGLPDQTPTPTRFLRNCEEIGLFQDLNKNPFDDDFRKAAESLSQEGSALNSPSAPDQLESADSEAVHPPSMLLANVVDEAAIRLNNDESIAMVTRMLAADHGSFVVRLPSGQLMPLHLPSQPAAGGWEIPPDPQQQVAPLPTTTSVAAAAAALPRDPCSKNTSPSASQLTKMRLKAVLKQNKGLSDSGEYAGTGADTVYSSHVAQVAILRQDADTSSALGKRSHSVEDPVEDEKRQKFLERNRAAAAKCRAKKKMWLNDIESKADEMAGKMRTLEKENSRLRDEVMQLKNLLLAHTDCPVTQLQQLAGQVFINGDQVIVTRSSQSQKSRHSASSNNNNKPVVVKSVPVLSVAQSTLDSMVAHSGAI